MRHYRARQFTDPAAAITLLVIVAMGTAAAIPVGGALAAMSREMLAWLGGVGVLLLVIAVVVLLLGAMYLILLHRMWDQIQDLPARTTAGAAVGLLFVPLFNLYWQFIAFHGLARDINRYIRLRGVRSRLVNEGLALAACCMAFAGPLFLLVAPMLHPLLLLAPLAAPIPWLLSLRQMARASAAIARARSAHLV